MSTLSSSSGTAVVPRYHQQQHQQAIHRTGRERVPFGYLHANANASPTFPPLINKPLSSSLAPLSLSSPQKDGEAVAVEKNGPHRGDLLPDNIPADNVERQQQRRQSSSTRELRQQQRGSAVKDDGDEASTAAESTAAESAAAKPTGPAAVAASSIDSSVDNINTSVFRPRPHNDDDDIFDDEMKEMLTLRRANPFGMLELQLELNLDSDSDLQNQY